MYQREVSRLGKENNKLHIEIMNIKETSSASQEKWRVSLKKLETEVNDLKILVSIHQTRYSELESEKDELKTRLDTVLTKIYNPANERGLNDPSLSIREQNLIRKQEFRISSALNESESLSGFTKSQLEWAQELQDSDERIKKYQEQTEDLIKIKEDLQTEIGRSDEKLKNRDKEIERLVEILNSGEFATKVPKRLEKEENQEKLKILTERLDFVNSEYMKMDQELTIARSRLAQVGNVHEERDYLLLKLDSAQMEITKLQETLALGEGGSRRRVSKGNN